MMVITASTELASSAGDFATLAPASASGLILSGVRFHTVSVWPPSISRAPMFEPIRPMPEIPICIPRFPSDKSALKSLQRLNHPVLDLGQRRNRAVVVEITAGRTADANTADQVFAGHDGHAARREVDIGQAGKTGGGDTGRFRNP